MVTRTATRHMSSLLVRRQRGSGRTQVAVGSATRTRVLTGGDWAGGGGPGDGVGARGQIVEGGLGVAVAHPRLERVVATAVLVGDGDGQGVAGVVVEVDGDGQGLAGEEEVGCGDADSHPALSWLVADVVAGEDLFEFVEGGGVAVQVA